jgi:mannose-1-phosphate guanylyltransferase/mannose-1-phosphate guanylyltransferase/mannose-6-phosphate isomerase
MVPTKVVPVLMAGGFGSRLWPLSRELNPKQLLRLAGPNSSFQEAVLRVSEARVYEPPIVIAGVAHSAAVITQLREIDCSEFHLVLEPAGRGTAAAAAVAGLVVSSTNPDALILLMPADHRIRDIDRFRSAVTAGINAALAGHIVLFGVQPSSPAASYGYIHAGAPLGNGPHVRRVLKFVEKPNHETATHLLAAGDYFWNSGIFLLSPQTLIEQLSRHASQVLELARLAYERSSRTNQTLHLDPAAFCECPSISFDHAVLEHTDRAIVVAADFDWADMGSWSTIWTIADRDDAGNAAHGSVLSSDNRNCYLRSEGPLVAAIGVEDLIVVATEDAVLVTRMDNDQEIRKAVERLRVEGADRKRLL